jgi:hypothetical protein
MTSIEPRSGWQPQTYEMEPVQSTAVDRQISNSKNKIDHLGTAETLGELAQSVGNPNIRYEDQAHYIEGGFGWAIVFCGSLVKTCGFWLGFEPRGNSIRHIHNLFPLSRHSLFVGCHPVFSA